MKLLSVFVFIGETRAAVMSPNPAFVPKVKGFHKLLKPFVNPNPNPDYSNDPAFDPAFEDEEGDNEEYNVFDFLAGRMQTRRYSQLMQLMQFYTLEETFDADKYWNYGCNCMIHGDRPLSDMGTGPGVDRLDRKCREYKLCQQCARAQHGDMCIGEFISYRRPRTRTILNDLGVEETHKVCRDTPDTCERALCECDLQFAKDHAKVSLVAFDPAHHNMLYNANAQEISEMCVRGAKDGNADRRCCGGSDNAARVYNNAHPNQFCCAGQVTETSDGYTDCVAKT